VPQQYVKPAKPLAEWTILVYMEADNSLEPFALDNVAQMQLGIAANSSQVNVLVQWDQPHTQKTLRYRIIKGGKVDAGSLACPMGVNPGQELVDCAQWVKNNYPAKKYAWILWNHGSGVVDIAARKDMRRGILYDESKHTFLSNQAFTEAFTQIKAILGQPIDLLAMDACMMAMLEVAYQIKGLANVVVASEQVEPGSGYAYDKILNPLTQNPTAYDAKQLAQLIVNSYGSSQVSSVENDFTASALDMNYVDVLKANVDLLVLNITACSKFNAAQVKQAVLNAREQSLSFYYTDYIDLYVFYQNMKQQVATIAKSVANGTTYAAALNTLMTVINQGEALLSRAIFANSVGSADSLAKGLSIYYFDPTQSASMIDTSYLKTLFAQQSLWLNFMKAYREVA
jgi:hypothetical protein